MLCVLALLTLKCMIRKQRIVYKNHENESCECFSIAFFVLFGGKYINACKAKG